MAQRKVKAAAPKGVAAKPVAPEKSTKPAPAEPKAEVQAPETASAAVKAPEKPAKPKPAKAAAEFKAGKAVAAPPTTAAAPAEVAKIVAAAPVKIEAAPAPVAEAIEPPAAPEAVAAQKNEATDTEGTSTMNKQINDTIELNREAADRFQSAFGDVNERAKAAIEKGTRLVEEFTDLTRGNVEAFVASSKVAARGVETLTQEAADFGRRSFEEASSTLKSFAEVKSPTDFFRLQSEFARAQFDALVAESSKISEQVIKLAGEVAEPITTRYSVAAERVKTLAL